MNAPKPKRMYDRLPTILNYSQHEHEILERNRILLQSLKDDTPKDFRNQLINEAVKKLKLYNSDWTRKDFNMYCKNHFDRPPPSLISIPRISSVYFGTQIETRGKVISCHLGYFVLQEESSDLQKQNIIPFEIQVHHSRQTKVNVGDYVKVIGTPSNQSHKGTNANLIYIISNQVLTITQKEADIPSNHSNDSFFNEQELANLTATTSFDLVQILVAHANEEGFQLVKAKSEEHKVCLLCYLHSKYNKKDELNTNCPFFINIRKIKEKEGNGFIWHVSTYSLNHNHNNDPYTFMHKTLTDKEKKFILSMMRNGISNTKIAKIISENTCKILSSAQIAVISKEEKRARKQHRITESEELRRYMIDTNGYYFYDDSKDTKEVIKRKVVATFTKHEYDNLAKFGDFVSIDPTFCPMSSNWSVIPLTVIGYDREIRSTGLVFASTLKSGTFRWILKLLCEILPTKDKITTLCSDDDVGLQGAFTETSLNFNKKETDFKILRLKRVICCWHKIQNFDKFIVLLRLPPDQETRYKQLFRLMGMTRDKELSQKCHEELAENEQIRCYMEMNVDEKIDMIAKSRINYFTCGYNTSSISESMNNKLKKDLPLRELTLTEIRQHLSFVENNSMLNNRYYKKRKNIKILPKDIVAIMSRYNVSENVAEAIAGSIEKSNKLEIMFNENGSCTIKDPKINTDAKQTYYETYHIHNNRCSCYKQESTGLPCSHYIRYLKETQQNWFDKMEVGKRWMIDYAQCISTENLITNAKIEIEQPQVSYTNEKEMFTILRARTMALVSLAAKDPEKSEIMTGMLADMEKKFDEVPAKEPIVIDEYGTRSGRKSKSSKKKDELICHICQGSHLTKNCPHREELRSFAPEGSSEEGRCCSLCHYSGHNMNTCPAFAAWKASKLNQTKNDNPSE